MSTIYNLNNGKVEGYNFEPLRYNIDLFKVEEMKKINDDEQIIIREDNKGLFTNKKNLVYECDSYVLRKNKTKNFSKKLENYDFIRRYLHSFTTRGNVEIKQRIDKDKELILFNPDLYQDRRCIQITPNLYLEYLLENEIYRSKRLQESDLSIFKDLFKIDEEPKLTFDFEEMKTVLQSDLILDDYEDTVSYVEDSDKIYKKLIK